MVRSVEIPVEATRKFWGDLRFERKEYRPLEEVKLFIEAPSRGARRFRIEWYDGLGRKYGERKGLLRKGKAEVSFRAGGHPGMHYVRLWFDPQKGRKCAFTSAAGPEFPGWIGDSESFENGFKKMMSPEFIRDWFENTGEHDRLANFYLRAETEFQTGNAYLDALFPLSRSSILLNRRRYPLPEGEVVGYTTADSGRTLDFWLRDMFYSALGFFLWESDVKSGFEAIFRRQRRDGSFPDCVDSAGQSARSNVESDVEYIAALALYGTWMVTGDDEWLKRNLPAVERGIRYCTSHPKRWDRKRGLVRRGHTCGTWDFDINLFDDWGEDSPAVAAVCDQSGLYLALKCLAEIYKYLGNSAKARLYRTRASRFRSRAVRALWDGEKFRHHLHLDHFDHGSFDESRQLAMGNVWAMTRGLADRAKCARIIETYRKRWKETGHRFPWWSLEPGYPVELGKALQICHYYLRPGGYCNGGMMSFVGAGLSLGAFENGEERFGAKLLQDYAQFLSENNGEIYTWYWPNMEPGFRCSTRNTTPHEGWGMGHWVEAFVRGLAGVKITAPGLSAVEVAPRWSAAAINRAKVVAHYPSCDRYIAYRYEKSPRAIRILLTGSPYSFNLRLLLPPGASVRRARLNGRVKPHRLERVGKSHYATMKVSGTGVHEITLDIRKKATKARY